MSNYFDKYNQSGVPDSERIEDPLQYMKDLAYQYLPLEKFGFIESVEFISFAPIVIFNSEYCRLKIKLKRWELYTGYNVGFYFGRLHAPDDSNTMIWQNKECYCWHEQMGSSHILDFLDGLSPIETINKKGFPKIINQIRETTWFLEKADTSRGPELNYEMEAIVWEYYGNRFFDLFDFRKPVLWEEYQNYIKEVHNLEGRISYMQPNLDQVC